MLIKNASAVMQSSILSRDIRIKDGIICDIAKDLTPECGEEVYDAGDAYLLPGFIDTHTHGAVMENYEKAACDINKLTEYEAKNGITSVAATIASSPLEEFKAAAKAMAGHIKTGTKGAKIAAIHAEGPFLNMKRKGGMKPENIAAPTVEAFEEMYDAAGGYMKIMTIAPELEGSIEVIRAAAKKGVKLSAGHTEATYEEMLRAIDAGVTRMTHTFNAAVPFDRRNPGVLGAALTDQRVTCEVICDFVHLHPAAVEMIYRLKGSGKFTAISDSEFGAGLAEGQNYLVDGRKISVHDGVAWLEDGTICGSARNLYHGFCNLVSLGIPLWEVSEMVSKTPAEALGIYDTTGSIEIGKCADLVVVEKGALALLKTFVDGKEAN